MTTKAKEKAKELVDKFLSIQHSKSKKEAKQCAKIVVDEVSAIVYHEHLEDFWEQVKKEIDKL